jgi:hypothetical protein
MILNTYCNENKEQVQRSQHIEWATDWKIWIRILARVRDLALR